MNERSLARIYTLMAAFFWGTSFVVIRWGLLYLPAAEFLFLRFLIATVIMLVIIIVSGRFWEFYKLLCNSSIVFAALLNALGYVLQFLGQQFTIATNASLLINTSAVFVAIFAHFILDEKLTKLRGMAILISLLGTVLLITNLSFSSLMTQYFLGDMLCLLAGLIWSLYIVYTKKITNLHADDLSLLTVWFFYTTIFSLPLIIFQGFKSPSINGWLAILYTSFLCTIIPFLLWFNGLKILEAVTSSIYFLMEVLISAILELMIFGLSLSLVKIIGALMMCLGMILTDISYKST